MNERLGYLFFLTTCIIFGTCLAQAVIINDREDHIEHLEAYVQQNDLPVPVWPIPGEDE